MGIGEDFERELSEEFGIDRVAGSGSTWYSKLDLSGKGARWSLKATAKDSFRITKSIIEEAIRHTEGIGGDGSTPVWAIRIGAGTEEQHDFVLIRKNDFKILQTGELKLIESDVPQQVEQRRKRARTPSLLRDES